MRPAGLASLCPSDITCTSGPGLTQLRFTADVLGVMRRLGVSVLFGLLLCAATPVSGASPRTAGWSRPTTVAYGADGVPETGFVQSQNGRWTDLVTLRARVGLELYPWLHGGSLGSPVHVPSSRGAEYVEEQIALNFLGHYPGVAINNAGAVVLGWDEQGSSEKSGLGVDECFCAVRAIVRRADGRFGAASTLAPASGPYSHLLGVEIGSGETASVLWEDPTEEVHFAESTDAGRFLAPKPHVQLTYPALLNSVRETPRIIEYGKGDASRMLYESEPPFLSQTPIGEVPRPSDAGTGTALVSDKQGDELAISTEWEPDGTVQTAYRPAGGTFGPVRTIAHTIPPGVDPSCDLSATMNEQGETLAAWTCEPVEDSAEGEFGQAALFNRKGGLEDLTGRHPATYELAPAVALDNSGRALVAWGAPGESGLVSLSGAQGRFGRYQTIVREPVQLTTISVEIAQGGTGLATWKDFLPDGAERIMIDHLHLPGSP